MGPLEIIIGFCQMMMPDKFLNLIGVTFTYDSSLMSTEFYIGIAQMVMGFATLFDNYSILDLVGFNETPSSFSSFGFY